MKLVYLFDKENNKVYCPIPECRIACPVDLHCSIYKEP